MEKTQLKIFKCVRWPFSIVVLMACGLLLLPLQVTAQNTAPQGDVAADVEKGTVTMEDIEVVLEAVVAGQNNPQLDLNKDGKVDMKDVEIVTEAYEKTPEGKAQLSEGQQQQ